MTDLDPTDERRIKAAAKALCAPDHKSDPGSPLSCWSCITEAEGALQAADAADPARDFEAVYETVRDALATYNRSATSRERSVKDCARFVADALTEREAG